MDSINKSVFVDISGSVSGFREYWGEIMSWYMKNRTNIKNVYLWDNNIIKSSLSELEKYCSQAIGKGGTNPELIANTLVKENIKNNIIIFTDGDVYDTSVQKCDEILKNFKIDNVECYIISQSQPNLSVTCPFTRNNTSQVFYKQARQENYSCQIKTAQDYEMIKELATINLETFNSKYSTIESLLIAKNMGTTGDPATKELLIKLKKNLAQELASSNIKNYGLEIRNHLKSNDFDSALSVAKTITEEYFSSDIGMDIEKRIGYLISLCGDLRGQYSVESIRSNRMMRADTAKVETDSNVEVETNELISNPVECPILMDLDVPQIMILDKGEPVLANLDKNIVDDIANCPLRILNYPEVVEKLKKSISHWVGIKADDMITLNPFTKEKLIGTIPLGAHSQHVDCGNYTISKLFSAGKIMGNLNMYMAVIWHLIKSGEFEFLNDIKSQVTEHLVYRLTNSSTYASMCGLPQFVLTKVPTDVAIWYCVNSCLLNQPTDRDTIRFHLFNLDIMLAMLDVLGYPVSENTYKQINRTKVLLSMLSSVKRNELEFRNKIYCLTQNAIEIDISKISDEVKMKENIVKWIPIDGQASFKQKEQIMSSLPKFYNKLSISEIIGLAQMVSPSKSASDIKLDVNWEPSDKTNGQVNWIYGLKPFNRTSPTICLKTFRPHYMVNYKNNVVPWTELVIEEYGPLDKIISVERKFIDFFMKYGKFANQEEYLTFCYNRYVVKNNTFNTTLPYLVVDWYQDCLSAYKPVLENIVSRQLTADQVKQIFSEYAPVDKRLAAQSSSYLAVPTTCDLN